MLRHTLSAIVLIAGIAGCTPARDSPDQSNSSDPAAKLDSTTEASATASAPTPSAEGAMSYIISPEDGAVVTGPVTVRFGLKGMGVAPAGVQVPNTGHHHLMVDVTEMPDMTAPLPADDSHIHYGAGQTETVLYLTPGTHTLQLILGDWAHTPHSPPVVSSPVSITVR